jgi:lipopolysaccharide transport system ATP-binding protein
MSLKSPASRKAEDSRDNRPESVLEAVNLEKHYTVVDKPWQALWRALRRSAKKGKERDGFCALRGINLELLRGETLGIIGRNGAGKSTLLQILCGTLEPDAGHVTHQGRIAALLELGAGFNPEFTGRENVYFQSAVLGLTPGEIDTRLPSILDFADIGKFIDQPVKHYSSGMYLRLAFAVAAHVDAEVLIVDEALAVGDIFFAQKCMRFFKGFVQHGALLFVSHDMGAITALCDRVLWLEKGEARMIGHPGDVVKAYAEAVYAEQQETTCNTGQVATATVTAKDKPDSAVSLRDARQDLIIHSNLRNDIRIPPFSPDAPGFGAGKARIVSVRLQDETGRPLALVVGGERVILEIDFTAREKLVSVIVGFLLQNRLGQYLFGDNTFLTYLEHPPSIAPHEIATARFVFRMPFLPAGQYSIAVGIAEGTQTEHIQHDWTHEALVLEAEGAQFVPGILGIGMEQIEIIKDERGGNA